MRSLFAGLCFIVASLAHAADVPRFRTDADGPIDPKGAKGKGKEASGVPEWHQLIEGQFPPENSAHAISGELRSVNHLQRHFQIRVDRNDSQDRGVWDLPLDAAMLPYGAIRYHGAPAALQDVPLGTHLHGLFYLKDPNDQTPPPPTPYHRKTPEYDFRRCFELEDDFTFHSRRKQLWKLESVDLVAMKLSATLTENGKAADQARTFDLISSTRVMQGTGFGDLKSLQAGQSVLFDLTWVTLYGPGRITDIWVDETSRQLATAQQLERHRNHLRERGLPGSVISVEDEAQIVTLTFFAGVDERLFDELSLTNNDNPSAPKGAIAVARESLMTYDPVNDRKGGNIIDIKKIPAEPGSSGVQIRVKVDMMLEGFRPRRVIRFYPATWKVTALPREEQFFGHE